MDKNRVRERDLCVLTLYFKYIVYVKYVMYAFLCIHPYAWDYIHLVLEIFYFTSSGKTQQPSKPLLLFKPNSRRDQLPGLPMRVKSYFVINIHVSKNKKEEAK